MRFKVCGYVCRVVVGRKESADLIWAEPKHYTKERLDSLLSLRVLVLSSGIAGRFAGKLHRGFVGKSHRISLLMVFLTLSSTAWIFLWCKRGLTFRTIFYIEDDMKYSEVTPENREAIYSQLIAQYGEGCGVCGKKQGTPLRNDKVQGRLTIHRDKQTDEIIGLLCQACNYRVVTFGGSVELLQKTIKYLNNVHGVFNVA